MHAFIGLSTFFFFFSFSISIGFPDDSVVKNLPAKADAGLIPGSGRSPGEGNGNPLQYSCPDSNPMDRGASWLVSLHDYGAIFIIVRINSNGIHS